MSECHAFVHGMKEDLLAIVRPLRRSALVEPGFRFVGDERGLPAFGIDQVEPELTGRRRGTRGIRLSCSTSWSTGLPAGSSPGLGADWLTVGVAAAFGS